MNEESKKQRMAQCKALPSPKMPWETYKRMISMSRFDEFPEEERPEEVLKMWMTAEKKNNPRKQWGPRPTANWYPKSSS